MNELPRIRLGALPTPFEPLPRLSALFGVSLWVKRDDLTGLAFGGNKTRKLELLVADALATGAKTLVTAGAAQSNHCRQTAAAAARAGLGCRLVLATADGAPSPDASGNLLLDALLGARVAWCTRAARDATLASAFDESEAAGERPYLVPYGGSNARGAAAYALAFHELAAQCRAAGVEPDAVVFASSSAGTQAGLVAGARLAGARTRVIGISVDEPRDVLRERVALLACEVADLLGEPLAVPLAEVAVEDEWAAPGYGVAGDAEREAIELFARHEGLLLDPVYTGRAAAGLVGLLRRGTWEPGATVVFWHTGGSPALFASAYRDLWGAPRP